MNALDDSFVNLLASRHEIPRDEVVWAITLQREGWRIEECNGSTFVLAPPPKKRTLIILGRPVRRLRYEVSAGVRYTTDYLSRTYGMP